MVQTQQSPSTNSHDAVRPLLAELCRMFWLVFGPVGLLFSGASIWKLPPWTFSYFEGLFWGVALLILVARFVDIRAYHGTTTEDRPATMSDFWRYAAKVLVLAAGIWTLAQSFQA